MRTLLPTLAAIAVAAVLVVSIDPLRIALSYALHGDIDALQLQLQDLGVAGALVLVAIILVHAVVLFPAEIPNAVAGLVYGFAVALPLVLAAWVRVRPDRLRARRVARPAAGGADRGGGAGGARPSG